jgi:inosine/xanthosine triphosphatase
MAVKPRFGTVCVGGTFDVFHRAHRALLVAACEAGGHVLVGVTSDAMAARRRKGQRLQSYKARAAGVSRCLRGLGKPFTMIRLDDAYGPAASGEYDAIAVSAETRPAAEKINGVRKRRGLRSLSIIEVPTVLAEDGLPLSSSRVRKNEVDREGRMRRLVVVVGSENPVKVKAVRSVFGRAFPGRKIGVRGVAVDSRVASEPYGKDVINGAIQRAQSALEQAGAHIGVGIEAGLFWCEHLQDYFDVQYCAIIDRGERITLGHGPGFQYPPPIMSRVRRGMTVGQAMGEISGIRSIGRKQGVVGYLSKGILVRKRLTETAVVAAILPRLNPVLYLFD